MKIDTELLSTFPLFSGIKKSDLEPMLGCINAHTHAYKKNDYISLTGDTLRYVGVVCSGDIHMVTEDIWGNKSLFAVFSSGELFGESSVCTDSAASSVSFRAATNCSILFMPFNRVVHSCTVACEFHHRLIENMVQIIAQKNVQLIEKLEIISKKTMREKILTYLSQQARIHGKKYFTTPLGRMELADYLCVDRSALTRELSSMRDAGLIDFDRNTFRFLKSE